MAQDFAYAYAELIKADKHSDGTMTVYGKATDDSLDMDMQICDPTWLDTAMPEWFKSGGNVREMHTSIAAGVAKEYEKKSDGHYISALVVDPLSVKKVENGVLKGFSIGIKSPRVVRDTKAVNGRIIDGQIIEVSLVDRPANPNAKLIMAKSVEGESSLVQVEELHEYKAPSPSDVFKKTKKGSKMEQIKQIAEMAKSLTPDTAKFDKTAFDNALKALAELIVVEANEMATEGHNEKDSIEELLDAVKHLFNWYEGEAEEGEVAPTELIELGADADVAKSGCDHEDSCEDCGCDGCKACKGCDTKMCKGCSYMAAKSVVADNAKCLECGCHNVSATHGLETVQIPAGSNTNGLNASMTQANVSTAQIVTPEQNAGSIKSAEADEVAVEETAETENSDVEASDSTPSVEEVVEKAVKSAMESVKAEIDSLRAEKESAVEKSVKLEAELATALTKAVAGGPKRTATIQSSQSNEYLVKAATYKAKAEATTDTVLQKGYMALYREFSAKAGTPVEDAE